MDFTEQIMLQRPVAIIDRFMSFKSMQVGYLLRIKASDARNRLKRSFLVQVLSQTIDMKIGHSPIIKFFKSDFALYGEDHRTPVVLGDDSIVANISLSAIHIPRFAYLADAAEGIHCGRDLSFENFAGRREHAYAAEIDKIEVFSLPNTDIPALHKAAIEFVQQVKARNEKEADRIERRERWLRSELHFVTAEGVATFRAEDQNGNRMLVNERGEFLVVRLFGVQLQKALYEVRSGPNKGKVQYIEYMSIDPDPKDL